MMHKETSGLPWLDQPVLLHSSRADTCKLTPEQCAYRRGHWRYWYEADHVYALNTVYFLIAFIAFFTLRHLLSYPPLQRHKRNNPIQRAISTVRSISYRSLQPGTPSLGVLLVLGVGFLFFLLLTLVPQPYYWPRNASYGNSPPIATRTGWMALALLPFVLALSTKANLVSALTGISHDRLQVFHHWTSYAMFVLALVHTFPFIIFHIRKGDMVHQWRSSVTYWTGVVALIFQTYLTVMSLPAFRRRYYEFFKATHLLAALVFVLFFFLHCDFRLSSWDYFIATGALYLFSLAVAGIRTTLIHGRHRAQIDRLPCGLLRITIPTVVVSWTPGQHIFLRFCTPQLGLHCLTAHPFTISSLTHDPVVTGTPAQMIFYLKPQTGITARLDRLAQQSPGFHTTVLLEGPYGGIPDTTGSSFDTVLVIAGGSGGGFALSVVSDICRRNAPENINIQIVYTSRSTDMARWFRDEIAEIDGQSVGQVRIHDTSLFSTSSISVSGMHGDNVVELEKNLRENQNQIQSEVKAEAEAEAESIQRGRPDLHAVVTQTATTATARLAVYACGPASMLHDVRNAAAAAQGKAELYLHTEAFSW
ncbi:hypothetical protein EYZ11_001321 [Aspergillus tanneri]|uniref:FAD-binding FR-type domain-containing protein n=1 Tax=Aspergillus tanneri TaxID=1220188 RepID=A0A4S3JV31_9EURO|nr:hypothetical protein EYZ11_001321 [Aspergillus tanneri]